MFLRESILVYVEIVLNFNLVVSRFYDIIITFFNKHLLIRFYVSTSETDFRNFADIETPKSACVNIVDEDDKSEQMCKYFMQVSY